MTCDGCGREVTLVDGHFCGQCSSHIAASINVALGDVSFLEAEVRDVGVGEDGALRALIDYEGQGQGQGQGQSQGGEPRGA